MCPRDFVPEIARRKTGTRVLYLALSHGTSEDEVLGELFRALARLWEIIQHLQRDTQFLEYAENTRKPDEM